jgi:hypothetical protein
LILIVHSLNIRHTTQSNAFGMKPIVSLSQHAPHHEITREVH